ncbi:MAG TPA: hypothetical protein VFR43_11160 [Gaiellaceae bacterium]|nr:hypothetical protein [Gaiellaceae bacterium]
MSGLTIAAVVVGVLLVLMLAGAARMLWRLYRGEEEMESGGSLGRQLFGRHKSDP